MTGVATHPVLGAAHAVLAADGTLYWAEATGGARTELRWLFPDGRLVALDHAPVAGDGAALSPDGRWLATTRADPDVQIWIHDLARGGAERVDPEGGNALAPSWSPDGRRLVFSSDREGAYNLWTVDRTDLAKPRRLTSSPYVQYASGFTPDGATVAFSEFHPDTRWDVRLVGADGARDAEPLLATPFDEFGPAFSPDGRLVAYVSNESGRWDAAGRWEVYVRPRDRPGLRVRVSTAGGTNPLWSADGGTLYYREGRRLLAVALSLRPELQAAAPRELWNGFAAVESGEHRAVYALVGAERFLVTVPGAAARTVLHVETRWSATAGDR